MPRFFMAAGNIGKGAAVITGSDADHAKVLRLKVGDEIVVCDGEGTDYLAKVREFVPGLLRAAIYDSVPSAGEPTVRVLVLAGLPKGERADVIVQKCTECGASEIIFFLCRRCVARLDESSTERKIARWQKIAEEAAKQSGRGVVPTVSVLPDVAEAVNVAKTTDLPLFLYETGERTPYLEAIKAAGEIKSAAIITGPEGGFENYEAELVSLAGVPRCSMGPRILRCETAPVVALSALMFATGNMQ